LNTTFLIALSVGIIAGILIGSRVVQRSLKEKPIYGGAAANALHWLGCAAFTGGVPAGLVDILLERNVLAGILLAFCFIGVSFASLLVYGLIEQKPRALAEAQDQGWTAEKARSSGL
jgi:CHASE2 domain-containing sensor protein